MKRSKNFKVMLSFEPAYQIIYWSLCWLCFFIAIIAALEYTSINWISIIFGLITIGGVVTARSFHLKIEDNQFVFSCGSKRKKVISLSSVHRMAFSKTRFIVLSDNKNSEHYRFYLNQKNKRALVSYIKLDAPTILVEELQETSTEY